VHKSYAGEVVGAAGVSFEIQRGQFFTLLGPSGCGKTTTLRCVAGLEEPERGRIVLDGAVLSDRKAFVPPHRRNIGMVFQSYAIWPHMRVFDNVAFPLQVGRQAMSRKEIQSRVGDALSMVRLDGLSNRMATQLSGGQQQRLALARALVRRPRLLLLDEPLSNLDAKLRDQMRTEVRQLQRNLGITALYVTHDQLEALSMSDRIAVMLGGQIVQEGNPSEIYARPASRFVAGFVGSGNFVAGTVISTGVAGRLKTPIGEVSADCSSAANSGGPATLFIRPENVKLLDNSASGRNVFAGRIEDLAFMGEYLDCRVRVNSTVLLARVHPHAGWGPGVEVKVELPVEGCSVLFEPAGTPAP
jgi:iron(III) transport system ATP-binding protein